MVSIGDKSQLIAGQYITSYWQLAKYSLVALPVCAGALSYWKILVVPIK
jgi:hypothetical protein